jgi:hypothetical protein
VGHIHQWAIARNSYLNLHRPNLQRQAFRGSVWSMVEIVFPCADQAVTGSGVIVVGGLLNVPVGMNCTRPFGKFLASALAGLAVTD